MNKMVITAKNAEYQIIEALKSSRAKRNKLGEMFIEGTECIKQAVKADIEITRILTKNTRDLSDWGKNIIRSREKTKIIEMSETLYRRLCDKTNPSELLITAKIKTCKLEDIKGENLFIILFDRPSDCGNLGSIIRSANAFNVDGIFIMGHGADVYEPKTIRASLGSVFFAKIINPESFETVKEFIGKQKIKNNMSVIGTDSAGDLSIRDEKINTPVMVIIGNEAKGMSIKLKALCDKIVRIPMGGEVNSLNVSCAASILMWEIYKTRLESNAPP
jgi:TrmH family RNA methyltransferase